MAGKAGLKAGLIGVAALLVTTLLSQFLRLQALVYAMCGVNMLIYAGIGVLAGFFLVPPRTPGKGAGAGAIAGLVGGAINGVIGAIIGSIRLARGLGLPGVPPEQMQMLVESGGNPTLTLYLAPFCAIAVGAGCGAIGGAILAAVKPD